MTVHSGCNGRKLRSKKTLETSSTIRKKGVYSYTCLGSDLKYILMELHQLKNNLPSPPYNRLIQYTTKLWNSRVLELLWQKLASAEMFALLRSPIATGMVGAGPPAHKHNLLPHSHKRHPSTLQKPSPPPLRGSARGCRGATSHSSLCLSKHHQYDPQKLVWAPLTCSSPKATCTRSRRGPAATHHPPWADVNSLLKTRKGNQQLASLPAFRFQKWADSHTERNQTQNRTWNEKKFATIQWTISLKLMKSIKSELSP